MMEKPRFGEEFEHEKSHCLSTFCGSPAEERFSISNLSANHVSVLKDNEPFNIFILSSWDNILGPILKHVWLGPKDQISQEDCVKYIVSRTLCGELLRDTPENIVDSKLFIFKDKNLICHSFVFMGKDKTGSNISSFSLLTPYSWFQSYSSLVELIEERCKLLLAKLRVLLFKDPLSAYQRFTTYLQSFINTIYRLKTYGLSKEIQLCDTIFSTFSSDNQGKFNKVFLLRAISSHLQTFGSTIVVGWSPESVNLMVSSLGMFISPEERCTSLYAVDKQEKLLYEPDLFVQGILKEDDNIQLPLKDIITSLYPTTLIDVDTLDVKQTSLFHEHCVKRKEFLDDMLALIWEDPEEVAEHQNTVVFHDVEDIGTLVQTLINDLSYLPAVDDIRHNFILSFMRILDRKALALIKYIEAKSKKGMIPLDSTTKRQLRQDLQLTTEADFYIVLVRAEKHKPGIYVFFMGDPRQSVARVQAILESL